jgi:transcriptional regulator with XRE-family HTH domain
VAKRRKAHPRRIERLAHLAVDELAELSRLGAHIAALRKTVPRRTITAVAQLAGINPSSLGELERGRVNPGYVVLSRLAAALDVSVASLVAYETVPDPTLIVPAEGSATPDLQ